MAQGQSLDINQIINIVKGTKDLAELVEMFKLLKEALNGSVEELSKLPLDEITSKIEKQSAAVKDLSTLATGKNQISKEDRIELSKMAAVLDDHIKNLLLLVKTQTDVKKGVDEYRGALSQNIQSIIGTTKELERLSKEYDNLIEQGNASSEQIMKNMDQQNKLRKEFVDSAVTLKNYNEEIIKNIDVLKENNGLIESYQIVLNSANMELKKLSESGMENTVEYKKLTETILFCKNSITELNIPVKESISLGGVLNQQTEKLIKSTNELSIANNEEAESIIRVSEQKKIINKDIQTEILSENELMEAKARSLAESDILNAKIKERRRELNGELDEDLDKQNAIIKENTRIAVIAFGDLNKVLEQNTFTVGDLDKAITLLNEDIKLTNVENISEIRRLNELIQARKDYIETIKLQTKVESTNLPPVIENIGYLEKLKLELKDLQTEYLKLETREELLGVEGKRLALSIRETTNEIILLNQAAQGTENKFGFADRVIMQFGKTLVRTIAMIPELLVFTLVFEALSLFTDWLIKGTQAMQDALKVAEEYGKKMESIHNTISKSLVDEKFKTQELINVAQDLNRTYESRTDAIKKLRDQYKGLFDDMTNAEMQDKNNPKMKERLELIDQYNNKLSKIKENEEKLKNAISAKDDAELLKEKSIGIGKVLKDLNDKDIKINSYKTKEGDIITQSADVISGRFKGLHLTKEEIDNFNKGDIIPSLLNKLSDTPETRNLVEQYNQKTPFTHTTEALFGNGIVSQSGNKKQLEKAEIEIKERNKDIADFTSYRDKSQKEADEILSKIPKGNRLSAYKQRLSTLEEEVSNKELTAGFRFDMFKDSEKRLTPKEMENLINTTEAKGKNSPIGSKEREDYDKFAKQEKLDRVEIENLKELIRQLEGGKVREGSTKKPEDFLVNARRDEDEEYKKSIDKNKEIYDLSDKSFKDLELLNKNNENSIKSHYIILDELFIEYKNKTNLHQDQIKTLKNKDAADNQNDLNKNKEQSQKELEELKESSERTTKIIEDRNSAMIKAQEDFQIKINNIKKRQNKEDEQIKKEGRFNYFTAFFGGSGKTGGRKQLEDDKKAYNEEIKIDDKNIQISKSELLNAESKASKSGGEILSIRGNAYDKLSNEDQILYNKKLGSGDTEGAERMIKNVISQNPNDLKKYDKAQSEYSSDESKVNPAKTKVIESIDISEKAKQDRKLKLEEEKNARTKAIEQAAFEATQKIANAAFDLQKKRIQQQMTDLQNLANFELGLAGNNAAAKQRIELTTHAKMLALKRKEAEVEKQQGVFSVIVDTAKGIAGAWSHGDPITAAIVSAIVGATGLAQIAAITSAPLPSFAKGGKISRNTPARINEEGFELVERDGKYNIFGGGKESIVPLKGGDIVHTHDESTRFLNHLLKGTGVYSQKEKYDKAEMRKTIFHGLTKNDYRDAMIEAIGSMKQPNIQLPADSVVKRYNETNKRNGL